MPGLLEKLLTQRPIGLLGLTASQMSRGNSAMEGELGAIAHSGNVSHEYSTTQYVPELGGWVNIPTMVAGQKDLRHMLTTGDMSEQQRMQAIQRAIERVRGGQSLPAYDSARGADLMAGFKEDLYRSPLFDYLLRGN